jgi:predicted GIY-YIG superfamily endonuclease
VPIAGRWRRIDRLPPVRGRDAMPGVYEIADASRRVVYIGQSATDVPNRIRQHLQRNACLRERMAFWRYAYSRVPQSEEATLIERHLEAWGELPDCNEATPRVRSALQRYRERSRG